MEGGISDNRGFSPKVIPHTGSGYIPSGNELAGFYSSDENNINNDSSQQSEGKSMQINNI